jgi:hypothetical protein
MKIAAAINRLTLMLVPKDKRITLRDGYYTLVSLGWPTEIITNKMCDKAVAGVMRRYMGVQSWIAYKQEWEWAESTSFGSEKTQYSKSID